VLNSGAPCRVEPKNLHDAVDFGPAAGKEV